MQAFKRGITTECATESAQHCHHNPNTLQQQSRHPPWHCPASVEQGCQGMLRGETVEGHRIPTTLCTAFPHPSYIILTAIPRTNTPLKGGLTLWHHLETVEREWQRELRGVNTEIITTEIGTELPQHSHNCHPTLCSTRHRPL